MPLNLSTNDGEFTPYLKYNAKAGRWYIRPQNATQDVEIVNPRLAVDFANIKTGWFYYAEGAGPEKVYDSSLVEEAPRPAGPRKFKRGFEVMVYGNDNIQNVGPLGLREWSSTASNVITAINAMYNEYERNAVQNPNKVPFFACTGVTPVQGAYGINYEPNFSLIGWVDRSKVPAFDEHLSGQKETAIAAPANTVPPPTSPDDYATTDSLNDEIPF